MQLKTQVMKAHEETAASKARLAENHLSTWPSSTTHLAGVHSTLQDRCGVARCEAAGTILKAMTSQLRDAWKKGGTLPH